MSPLVGSPMGSKTTDPGEGQQLVWSRRKSRRVDVGDDEMVPVMGEDAEVVPV